MRVTILGIVALTGAAACVGDNSSTPDSGPDATGPDATSDSAVVDSPVDQTVGDADAAETGPTYTYSALNDTSKWSTFDTTTAPSPDGGLATSATGFNGVAFDGKYAYFVPNGLNGNSGLVTRYDTTSTFTNTSSWATFDVTGVNAAAHGFASATFDGKYVYFSPWADPAPDGYVARYDTTASFTSSASWLVFNAATVGSGTFGFFGSAFDGRYVYFAPFGTGGGVNDGLAVRYDTTGTFTNTGSWSTFNIASVNASAKGFYGLVFDGRYMYYVPNYDGTAWDGVVARFDTTASSFSSTAAWSTFDTATVDANAVGFFGGAFDGRHVYLFPRVNGVVVQYDTTAPFGTAGSWSSFNITTVNAAAKSCGGGAFDGRYVYLIPWANGSSGGYPTWDGILVRYDTQTSAFTTGSSWSSFDLTTITSQAKGFVGALFDGSYLYLSPNADWGTSAGLSTVARFSAKTPSLLPPGPAHGSFF